MHKPGRNFRHLVGLPETPDQVSKDWIEPRHTFWLRKLFQGCGGRKPENSQFLPNLKDGSPLPTSCFQYGF